jgi:SAM-dependent methyltransferase
MTLVRLKMCADWINQLYLDYSLLDVGCRTMDLKPLLLTCQRYTGADLLPGKGVVACDLEKELPFEDNSYDIVTALDVLEHLDNPHGAIQELQRIARRAVFISLPNIFYYQFRWNFIRGYGLSGKYSFSPTPILDRHRWVMSYTETINFVYQNAGTNPVQHKRIMPARGRTKLISEPLQSSLAQPWPNMFVYGSLFFIQTG